MTDPWREVLNDARPASKAQRRALYRFGFPVRLVKLLSAEQANTFLRITVAVLKLPLNSETSEAPEIVKDN